LTQLDEWSAGSCGTQRGDSALAFGLSLDDQPLMVL